MLFIVARAYFIIVQHDEASNFGLKIFFSSFMHGFKLDLSATCYLLLIPLLVAIPGIYFTGNWYKTFLKKYTFIFIAVITAVVVSDAQIYTYWAFRLEYTSLEYIRNPGEAVASLAKGEIYSYLIPFIIFSAGYIFTANRLINRTFSDLPAIRYPVPGIFVLLFLIAFLIIPIRGGTGTVPLNVSASYFSESMFPNHAAVNVTWNLAHTTIYRKPVKNPYIFTTSEEAAADVRELTLDSGSTLKVLNNEKANVIIIILESFGSFLVETGFPDTVITPYFKSLIPEGIYFSDIYATGSRTDKVIPAILSGYPNLPALKILQEPRKSSQLPGLVKLLDNKGYKSSFWYGGDLNFANLNSYILGSGFNEIVTRFDFSPAETNSKWGVHDHLVLNRMIDSINSAEQPFVYTLLTLSSHEPFEVPMDPYFTGSDIISRFKNSAYYTDRALGDFIDRAKAATWWNNTLIVLIADHCRRNSSLIPVYSEEIFKIPMLWLGGALAVKDTVISRVGNQYDLPLMVSNQLNIEGDFRFSKDLLSSGSKSFAFYTYFEGFSFITDSLSVVYDISLGKNVVEKGNNPAMAEKYGKSFLQFLFDDYLSR